VGRRIVNSATRFALHRLRVYPLAGRQLVDTNSPEYLYLIQQSRRLSLAASIARLRPRNVLMFPLVLSIVFIKAVDLWITNQIVRSMINERDLMEQSLRSDRPNR
jgi:hypothetical protein